MAAGLALAMSVSAPGLMAQPAPPAQAAQPGDEENAPQVLSSDLIQVQEVKGDKLVVHFVVIGKSALKTITINGEAQNFEPSDTVAITKEFSITQPQTLITVTAVDVNGLSREKQYLVTQPGVAKAAELKFNFVFNARFEIDENPTNDLSLPFGVTIPNVTLNRVNNTDSRTNLTGTGVISYGSWSALLGANQIDYTKAVNKPLGVQLLYGGGGYRYEINENNALAANLMLSKLSIGGSDYDTMQAVSAAYEHRSADKEGFYSHKLGMDFTQKTFASASQTAGSQYAAKWDYNSLDAERQDNFESVIAYGTATEGDKLTDYSYYSFDFDWINRWSAGFRFDIGFGNQYRDYPNDKQPLTTQLFGVTRADDLLRISTGLGWQFNPLWSLMLSYRYLTDISNKVPYVRPITGLELTGGF